MKKEKESFLSGILRRGRDGNVGEVFQRIRPRSITNEELIKAERLGGSDWDTWSEYSRPVTNLSCNKGGHRMRSLFHQGNHYKYWKKLEKSKKK